MTVAFRRPVGVGFVQVDPRVDGEPWALYLARLPDGPLVMIEGSGAAIWRAAVADGEEACGGVDAVVQRVADDIGVAAEAIREDVVAFLAELVAGGLLEPAD